jgi:hypothetical protein
MTAKEGLKKGRRTNESRPPEDDQREREAEGGEASDFVARPARCCCTAPPLGQ